MAPYDALCCCPSAAPRARTTSCPSWRTSRAAAASPASGSRRSASTTILFGGVSPINARTATCSTRSRRTSRRRPWTCRCTGATATGRPTSPTPSAQIADAGHRRVLVLATSAYASYSGCRQYRENLAGRAPRPGRPRRAVDKLRHYFNHPGFVEPMPTHVALPRARRPPRGAWRSPRTPFRAGIGGCRAGRRRLRRPQLRRRPGWSPARPAPTGRGSSSTSPAAAPPAHPWLEPDICDHLEARTRPAPRRWSIVPDRLRLRPHGGQVRPRHRGRRQGRRARACPSPAPPPRAPTRASPPPCRDLVLERPPRSAAPRRPAAPWARSARATTSARPAAARPVTPLPPRPDADEEPHRRPGERPRRPGGHGRWPARNCADRPEAARAPAAARRRGRRTGSWRPRPARPTSSPRWTSPRRS